MNIWIEKTLVNGFDHKTGGDRAMGKVLWSPRTGKDGRNTYKNMKLVMPGDLVIHFIDNSKISGISEVEKEAIETEGLEGTPWDKPSYLIKLKNYIELNPPVERGNLLNDNNKDILNRISETSEVFYNRNMNLRQGGYLSPCPIELLTLVNEIYKVKSNQNLPFVDEKGIILSSLINEDLKRNYWIFQGNPDIYNITNALKGGHLQSWKVAAHKDKIKIGDKVIIWQTGSQAGCYALAEVTSNVGVFKEEPYEIQHYIEPQTTSEIERVKLKIDKYLTEQPILWSQIKDLPQFTSFKAGNQGANFAATKEEYKTILALQEKLVYSWVQTHKELVKYLAKNKENQIDLIGVLKKVGITGLHDENEEGKRFELKEIDPFTFFCYIYKYGSEKRLKYLQDIALELNIAKPLDDNGIPSVNAQKVCLFPYESHRKNNEINRLWDIFEGALNDTITNEQFQDVLNINSTGKIKLTEGLFNILPDKFLPINGPTKPFIEEKFGINPNYNSYSEYEGILEQIRSKTDKPFYQLSHEAWLWNDEKNSDLRDFKKRIKKSNQKSLQIYFQFLDRIIIDLDVDDSENLVFSTGSNQLSFQIGKRYCLNLKKDKFFFITPENYEINNVEKGLFAEPDVAYYYKNVSNEEVIKHYNAIEEAVEFEITRDNHTKEKEYDNSVFRKAVFDKEFRATLIEFDDEKREIPLKLKAMDTHITLNKILFGPPGTGKTFTLKEKYFDKFTISESSLSKEQFILNLVSDLTWWQTFAIALYDSGKTSVNQLLEHAIVKAKASLSNAKNIRPIAWNRMQAHVVPECPNVHVADSSEPSLFYKEADSEWRVVNEKVETLYPEGIELLEQINNFQPNKDKTIKNYEFVTFHQSFSYEDFVEGIKPILEDGNSKLEYEINDGVFKKLCQRAEKDLENNYAIFIDEINRGNVSAIFGELITLIENDKRIGNPQEIKVKLPYSKTEFGVPPNLYIIGTMNTADRSVEALDTALRRRFSFIEVMPNPELLKDIQFDGYNLSEVLQTINERIELLLDRDHTIGHSYFINLKSGDTQGLLNIFENNIIPLLQEYFYQDYEKIALVLGKGFVEVEQNQEVKFANFKEANVPQIESTFKLISPVKNIEEAIGLLLNTDE